MGSSCKFEKLSRQLRHEMACYSSNFATKLQMVIDVGKEYLFTLNFNMPRSFTRRKSDLWPKNVAYKNGEQPIRLPNGLLYPRVEAEQRTHSWDEIA